VSQKALSIHVNGERRDVSASCTVAELLDLLELDGRRIAVAINRDVVPRSSFGSQALTSGDRVEILEAVGGG